MHQLAHRGGGGRGTLIYSYIGRLWGGSTNSEFQYIYSFLEGGEFRIFFLLGYENFVDIFRGYSQILTIF